MARGRPRLFKTRDDFFATGDSIKHLYLHLLIVTYARIAPCLERASARHFYDAVGILSEWKGRTINLDFQILILNTRTHPPSECD